MASNPRHRPWPRRWLCLRRRTRRPPGRSEATDRRLAVDPVRSLAAISTRLWRIRLARQQSSGGQEDDEREKHRRDEPDDGPLAVGFSHDLNVSSAPQAIRIVTTMKLSATCRQNNWLTVDLLVVVLIVRPLVLAVSWRRARYHAATPPRRADAFRAGPPYRPCRPRSAATPRRSCTRSGTANFEITPFSNRTLHGREWPLERLPHAPRESGRPRSRTPLDARPIWRP